MPSYSLYNLSSRKTLYVFPGDELSKPGIVGMFPGATRVWKLDTYGLSREKIDYLSDAF